MKTALALCAALVIAAPVSAQPGSRCWLYAGQHTPRHYVCVPIAEDNAVTVPHAVSRAWFNAHCQPTDPASQVDAATATCTGDDPPEAKPGEHLATPPGFWHRVKIGAEVGAAMGLFFLIVAAGGGGFAG